MEKKDLIISYIHYLLLFLIIGISNFIGTDIVEGKVALVIAVIWMVLSITIYFLLVRKNSNKPIVMIYTILNAIMAGLACSAYYSLKNVEPYEPILKFIAFGILMLINYCLLAIIENKSVFTKANMLLSWLLFMIAFFIWIDIDRSIGSSLVFMSIIYLCFSYALYRAIKKNSSWSSIVPFASLLMFSGILLLVILVLTEGEGLDVLEIAVPDGTGKKRGKP